MPPVLVLLNGVPGSGKSTLAGAWCARHADRLPLALDVDLLRAMIGGWRASLAEAGHAARAVALAAITVHLEAGHDVIVPQYLRREPFADALRATADAAGAAFVEVALVVDAATAHARFRERAHDGDVHGGLEAPMADVVAGFERFLAGRPEAVRVEEQGKEALDRLDGLVRHGRTARKAG